MRSIILITIALVLSVLLAMAGSHSSIPYTFNDSTISLFAFCALVIFIIQWLAFIPAWFLQSERFFDLTGSLTYISIIIFASVTNPHTSTVSFLLAALVCLWALRLGSFLFIRILKDGSDKRFDEIKPNFIRFFSVWTLQGLWVLITCSAALTVITSQQHQIWNTLTYIGLALWIIGFGIEVVADSQKRKFRAMSNSFINIGLWSKSRHPQLFWRDAFVGRCYLYRPSALK